MRKIYFYFWNFVICSILGFIIETIWCIIRNKKFESRKGLLYGPFIPIYGIAGMILAILITELNIERKLIIFLLGVSVSTIIEYVASYLQEKVFGSKSWDYSHFRFNIKGRVNLQFSIFFGFAILLWYLSCYELTIKLFNIINYNAIEFISTLFILFMIYNIIISTIAVYRTKERVNKIERNSKFWNYIDKKYPNNKVLKVYANMKFI